MKKLLSVVLILILLTGTAAGETFRCTVSDGETVNVRSSPSTKASTGGRRLFSGDTVEGNLLDDNKWIVFKDADGEIGYVMSKYMEIAYVAMCTVSANGRVRWRKTPGGKTGGYYQPDDTVYVQGIRLDSSGTYWARTTDGNSKQNRYVSLDYLVTQDGTLLSELY